MATTILVPNPRQGPIGADGITPIGDMDLTVYLGGGASLYTYSNMTESTLRAAPTTGSWFIQI
jgi:hypothetical protein